MIQTNICYCNESGLSVPHYVVDHAGEKAKIPMTLEQETDQLVKKYNFDRNEQHYGALDEVEHDEELLEMRETLMDFLEQGMREEYVNKLHLLLEIEYQLTNREDK